MLLVARLSPRFRYYPAVRLLPEHRFSFRWRLWSRFPRCHPRTLEVLLGSRPDLPYRAVRKHLGTVGEWERLRPHSAGSTLSHLWPTGSSLR